MRHLKWKYMLLSLLVGLPLLLAGQENTKSQLASKYYINGEYEKAAELYGQLYQDDGSRVFFNYYLNSLFELGAWDEAEKACKTQIRKYPNDLTYLLDLGQVYEKQQEQEQANTQYDKAIRRLDYSRPAIRGLASAFLRIDKSDYAEKVYLTAREKYPQYRFNRELAQIYMTQRRYDAMFDAYMRFLEQNPGKQEQVQNDLQVVIGDEPSGELADQLRVALLKEIRGNPASLVFNEMLIWLFVQQQQFDMALRQAIALDKRRNEDGRRIMGIAADARSNTHFDVAEKGYQYVIDKGRAHRYYFRARILLLSTLYEQIKQLGVRNTPEVKRLEKNYKSTIDEFGASDRTVEMLRDLGHIQAFYLDKPQQALKTLNKALAIGNLNPYVASECKIEKADVLLFQDNPWEATLLYAKVEKENKGNTLGYEARFRKARLAYFTGDFEWALAQLNSLKASTSQLVANDAFELAELINANLDEEGNHPALALYSRADRLLWQHKDSLAQLTFDSLTNNYPDHALMDEVFYKRAQMAKRDNNWDTAIAFLQQVLEAHSNDIFGDDALYETALIYETKKQQPEVAMQHYKQLLSDYPGSIYINESRSRFRRLRGD